MDGWTGGRGAGFAGRLRHAAPSAGIRCPARAAALLRDRTRQRRRGRARADAADWKTLSPIWVTSTYDDVPAVYRRADLFASPTYSEGFSNTILEAMSAGLPIVSCHAVGRGGLSARRRERPAGATRATSTPLADALGRLLDDGALRRRLAECAFEEVHRLYSWPVVARQIAGVYEQVRAHRAGQRLDAARPAGPGVPLPRRAAFALNFRFAMPTALFLSPHLDDVAFSCGGTLLRLTDDPRWRVVLCTVFTASVADPQGFALRCQTDKGIAAGTWITWRCAGGGRGFTPCRPGVDEARHWQLPGSSAPGLRVPGCDLFAGASHD